MKRTKRYNRAQMQGSGFFGNVFNIAKKAFQVAKKYKLISRGLALIPDKRAQVGSVIAGAVGLGKRRPRRPRKLGRPRKTARKTVRKRRVGRPRKTVRKRRVGRPRKTVRRKTGGSIYPAGGGRARKKTVFP